MDSKYLSPAHSTRDTINDALVTSEMISANEQCEIGLWAKRFTVRDFANRPCLFLDRDGVIVEETHYLHKIEDVVFVPAVAAVIAEANRGGIPVVVVTNQAGIGRGHYDWDAFAAVAQHILNGLGEQRAKIDMMLACAYHADGVGAYAVANHPWRKPHPGMLLEAARVLGINLTRSFIVGDKVSDLMAGMTAELTHGALTMTGHGKAEYAVHKATLDEWRAEGRFNARVVESPAVAIRDWLKEVQCDEDNS